MGWDLLLFASLLTAACLQHVPSRGSGHLPVDVSLMSGDQAPETGTEEEVEVGARCRLQPLDQEMAVDAGSSAPAVAGPGLLLVPEGVSVGAVVALVEAPAPGVECRLVGGGFRLRRTVARMFTVVTTAALDRERRDEYRLRLVTGGGGGGESPFTVRVTDVNDNSPVFTAPRPPWVSVSVSPAAESGCPAARTHLLPVTAVKAADADSGPNGELVYELAAAEGEVGGVFGMGSGGELRANVCRLSGQPGREWRVRVRVWDRGSPRRSASTVLTVSFVPAAAATGSLAPAAVAGLALAAVCAALLPVALLLRSACGDRWRRRRRDGGAYNCRRAETDYRPQPRRPERLIHKTDIALLPTSRRAEPPSDPLPLPLPAAGLSGTEPQTPSPGRQRHRHRQLLRELVRLSRAGCPDGSLDLAAGSPHVQQISQLLSLLHQGQFQARPNFRGNKYLKTCRGTEADRPTRKDSGQGESEGGDSDSDVGSTPPLHELLNEGLNGLLARGSWTTSPGQGGGAGGGERLSLEDLFWALPSTLPSDYKENVFSLESETAPETADGERTTFSTFGKGVPEHGAAFLTEMAVLFHQLWEGVSERSSDGRLPSLHESPEQRAGSEPPAQ